MLGSLLAEKTCLKVTASTTTKSTTRRSGDQMDDQITPGDQILFAFI